MAYRLSVTLLGLALCLASQAFALEYKMVPGAGGVPLNTVEAGDKTKPAILLVHGFAQSHSSFKKQLESADLTRDYHLVAFDLRGHGNSGKPWKPEDYKDSKIWADDVAAVMDATGIQKAVVVGWSYGGFVLANYVEHYGTGRILGLNLAGSAAGLVIPPFPAPPPNADPEIAKQRMATAKQQISGNIEENLLGAQGGIAFLTNGPGDETWQSISRAGSLLLLPYVRAALQGRSLDNTKVMPMLATLPVLVTYGSADGVIGPVQLDGLKKGLKNATYSVYDGAGHSTFYEAGERFNKELSAFAKSVQPKK
ncbi:MAG: alpha/beta hydrolase [Rhodospirillaceae bacterium]|nr:alpha/beta hydrolase [Rhodospirillaceae bacterium]